MTDTAPNPLSLSNGTAAAGLTALSEALDASTANGPTDGSSNGHGNSDTAPGAAAPPTTSSTPTLAPPPSDASSFLPLRKRKHMQLSTEEMATNPQPPPASSSAEPLKAPSTPSPESTTSAESILSTLAWSAASAASSTNNNNSESVANGKATEPSSIKQETHSQGNNNNSQQQPSDQTPQKWKTNLLNKKPKVDNNETEPPPLAATPQGTQATTEAPSTPPVKKPASASRRQSPPRVPPSPPMDFAEIRAKYSLPPRKAAKAAVSNIEKQPSSSSPPSSPKKVSVRIGRPQPKKTGPAPTTTPSPAAAKGPTPTRGSGKKRSKRSDSDEDDVEDDADDSGGDTQRQQQQQPRKASTPRAPRAAKNAAAGASQELYCTCRRPDIPGLFMIACDRCDEWFHGECVGLTAAQAQKMKHYVCAKCRQKRQQEKIERQETERARKQCVAPGCTNLAKPNSKYCCDDCGVKVAQDQLRARTDSPIPGGEKSEKPDRGDVVHKAEEIKKALSGRPKLSVADTEDLKALEDSDKKRADLQAEIATLEEKRKALEKSITAAATLYANGQDRKPANRLCGFATEADGSHCELLKADCQKHAN